MIVRLTFASEKATEHAFDADSGDSPQMEIRYDGPFALIIRAPESVRFTASIAAGRAAPGRRGSKLDVYYGRRGGGGFESNPSRIPNVESFAVEND